MPFAEPGSRRTHLLFAARNLRPLFGAALLTLAVGCAKCAPETVGTGVARLTIRNVGAIASAANADEACGFKSPDVLGAPTIEGEVGGLGTVTWKVADCAMDFGGGTVLSTNCEGGTTTAHGKVTVTARRSVKGILTGNATNPVVPASADAVTITIENATFESFGVEVSGSPNILWMNSGSISATLRPKLAVAASNGACAIASPNVAFSDVQYGPSALYVVTPDREFDVDVTESALAAQNGTDGDTQNAISGTIGVWEDKVTVPEEGDTGGLDPDFNADKFDAAWACTPDLAQPVSYTCGDLTPLLADGAARLTVKAFGTVVSMLDANTTCGFSSAAAKASAVPTGTLGGQGALTFSITDCTVTLPADTKLSPDCSGAQTVVGGTVKVSGKKTLKGRLTGSSATPIVPTTDSPAEFDLTVTFDKFKVGSSTDVNALAVKSGTLSGKLSPRTALSSTTGACSVSSPVAHMDGLKWTDGRLSVISSSGTFDLPVDTSALNAVNGNWERTNVLEGALTVRGQSYSVPGDGKGLNPSYDQAAFDAGWQCAPGLVKPVSQSCGFVAPLAQGVARLTPRTLGTVASLVDGDKTCGFSSTAVAGTPALTGTVGKAGATATFTLPTAGCEIVLPADFKLSTDCKGVETHGGGKVVVTGTKTVAGIRTGNPLKPIVPTNRDPATFDLAITFTDFKVTNTGSTAALTVKSGSLAGKVSPRTGLDKATGACSIATPVVAFADMAWNNAKLVLESDGSTFGVTANASSLNAQNGTKDGATTVSNKLTGSITLEGVALPIPLPGGDDKLDPAFDQTKFDESYTCNPSLVVATSDAMCGFKAPLAGGLARLTPRTLGTVASLVDANTSCGFSSAAVGGTPTLTGTLGKSNGQAVFTITNPCTITLPANTVVSTDCTGATTKVSGTAVVTGTKTVKGFRTGNPLKPIVPTSRDPALFDLSVTFTDFKVENSASTNVLTAKTGALTGKVAPRTGIDKATGACSISTPVVTFSDMAWSNADVEVVSDGSHFLLNAATSALNAQNGTKDTAAGTTSNKISGSLTVDGAAISLATAGEPLDPAFSQTAFDATYTCNPSLVVAPVEAACSFLQPLGIAAARLLVKNVATATSVLNKDTTCGFSSSAVLGAGTTSGTPGSTGSITWTASACTMGPIPADTTISTNCLGAQTKAGGTLKASGTKKVTGMLTGSNPPIVPVTRDAALFDITSLELTGFALYDLPQGATGPATKSTVTGTAALKLTPYGGESATNAGVYSISTPVAKVAGITMTLGQMSIVSDGSRFDVDLTDVALDAFAGAHNGSANSVSGALKVDGQPVTIAATPVTALDPAFVQATFDSTYSCTPDLKEPIPAN